jgi:predicted metal-dependent hydrolase
VQLALPFASGDDASVQPVEPVQFYFVRHRRAGRYLLRVEPDGRVRVTIPRGGSRREADAFAGRHLDWITRQRAQLPVRIAATPEQRRAWIAQARRELPPRLLQLAGAHGLTAARVSIRDQRSRWGSCGRDGHICLNWRLVRMPDWVRDYVMIHELMHLRRMDHSPKYWKLVAAACPEYEAARAWLRANGRGL